MPNSYTRPVSASDITNAGGALESIRAAADTALAAPSYVTLANSATLANERVLTGTANQITITDNGANGTVVLSTPQNIHTGASPTFAGEILTAPLKMTGTHTALGSTETGVFRDASGQANIQSQNGNYVNFLSGTTQYGAIGPGGLVLSGTQTLLGGAYTALYRDTAGNMWVNTPAGTGLAVSVNNTQYLSLTSYGINFAGNQSLYSNSAVQIYRDSSGNLNSNVAGGKTHIARVAGVRVGGFPLIAGDLLDVNYPAAGVSCAGSGAFTTVKSLSGVTTCAILIQAETFNCAILFWDGTTLTWTAGESLFVISASPNSSQFGLQVSSGNLQVKNGTVTTRKVAAHVFTLQ